MPDQRQAHETRTRVDELGASFKDAVTRQDRRIGRIAMWLIVITVAGLASNALLWRSNDARIQQINQERARNTLRACAETNARHDRTLAELDRLVAAMPPGPRKDRARQGRVNTAALIEALAPKRDCLALTERQVTK